MSVTVGVGAVVIVGGTAVLLGMATLFFILVSAIGHSLLKRFDLSSRFYLLGLLCGAVGVTLGILMSPGGAGTTYATFWLVHGHLNLAGFVGFAGPAILFGVPVVAAAAVGLWFADFLRRLVGVERHPRDRS